MNLTFTPGKFQSKRCLIMVGGTGDTAERFGNIVNLVSKSLPDLEICTFTMTEKDSPALTHDTQVKEVEEIVNELIAKYQFEKIDIFCTSMGAFSTSFLISNPKFSEHLSKVIFFDPADYYTDPKLTDTKGDSWAGPQDYSPVDKLASDKLLLIKSNLLAHVVKLTVRNYGENGYVNTDYRKRDEDIPWQYPRLNTKMVMSFYEKLPSNNKGQYIEVNHLPHGFLRDGNIERNEIKVAQIITDLLALARVDTKVIQ